MVKYISDTDYIFAALADPTRRDILARVAECEMPVGKLAAEYEISLPAVSRHLRVLRRAGLIMVRKDGQRRMVMAVPGALDQAAEYLDQCRFAYQSQEGASRVDVDGFLG